jgi:type I restriction enzyme S subunit
MRSNYKRLGDFICEVNNRNTDLAVTNLLGINIDKFFMPSVANIVGTDMTKYKIVKKGQFSCNRMHVGRDERLPVALSKDANDFLVSPAYDVFEVIDTEKLLSEYLMMWFSRREFDRNAWFYTDADVRGGLNWKAFCDMQLPIPDIAKQREIVKEYNILVNRIALNNQLIQKLEETAQTIYKRWFVDFEFPDQNGKPYKSNGGEMVESELGEIPRNWKTTIFEDIIDKIIDNRGKTPPLNGGEGKLLFETFLLNKNQAFPSIDDDSPKNKYVSQDTFSKWFRAGHPQYLDILFSTVGNGIPSWTLTPKKADFCIAQNIIGLRLKNFISPFYLRSFFSTTNFISQFSGRVIDTAQPSIRVSDIKTIKVINPEKKIMDKYHKIALPVYELLENKVRENKRLLTMLNIVISKLATIEN